MTFKHLSMPDTVTDSSAWLQIKSELGWVHDFNLTRGYAILNHKFL
jgi:hypothetical protein